MVGLQMPYLDAGEFTKQGEPCQYVSLCKRVWMGPACVINVNQSAWWAYRDHLHTDIGQAALLHAHNRSSGMSCLPHEAGDW